MRIGSSTWGSVLAVAVAAAAQFAVGTAVVGLSPAALLAASATAGAFGGLALVYRGRRRPAETAAGPPGSGRAVLAVAAGALFSALWVFGANRYSDAPTGSDTLFLVTAGWVAVTVAVCSFDRSSRPAWSQAVAALAGLAGAAAVLANWERPSSFSPFVRYTREELAFLLAGVLWAVFLLALRRVLARPDRARLLADGAGISVAALFVTFAWTGAPAADAVSGTLVYLAAWAVMAVGLAGVVTRFGPVGASAPLLLVPVLLTALSAVETATGSIRGASPLVLPPLAGGVAVLLFAALGVQSPVSCSKSSPSRSARVARIASCVAPGLAVAGLAFPALAASVVGERFAGAAYRVSWEMLGAETIGGWLALTAALTFAWVSWCAPRSRGRAQRTVVAWCIGGLVVAAAWIPARDVPSRTWTRWIPSEVQQDYGTEYATLTLRPVPSPAEDAAVGLSALGLLVSGADAARRARGRDAAETTSTEEDVS